MRRHEKEITDISEIEEILQKGQVCHIGLSNDGQPYVVPMNYGYRDGYLYLHSAPVGQKVDMARKNPKICFEVDIDGEVYSSGPESCNWSCKYRSIISTGRMESPEKAEEIGIYAIVMTGKPDISKMDFSNAHTYTESDNNMMWFITDRP
jgi:hypothetical protein